MTERFAEAQVIKSKPLVSIIIDNYNYGRFVGQAIESALNQTYAHVEVIVVDDGSTDNSREVVGSYSDRITSVFKANGGQASAFNAGFRVSRGEVIVFLDSDDMLAPQAAEEVVRAWQPGTAKAQYVLEHIDAEGRRLGAIVPYDPGMMPNGDARTLILSSGGYAGPPTSGNAFSRRVLERLMPLPEREWRQAADTSLGILAPFFGDVVSLKRIFGFYRVHDSNHGALSDISARKLRVKLIIDAQREASLRELGRQLGLEIPADWLTREPGHFKYRLASLRIDPKRHPFLDDTSWQLVLGGVSACWKNPRPNLRSRLFHTAWFPLVALLPAPTAMALIKFGLLPRRRVGRLETMRWMEMQAVNGAVERQA
jgi:glycosyltransferase involved in cell wall biosynthesis